MDIFISYSHRDNDAANKLFHLLSKNWSVWKDDHTIPNGVYWRHDIDKNLDAAPLVVVLVSPDAMKSAYVTYEWCYKWFKDVKDLNDLYFIRLTELNVDDEGMFGRIRADLQIPVKVIHSDADWGAVVEDINTRLGDYKEMLRHRNILIDRTQKEELQFRAISYLGQVHHFRRKTCEFLIEGMEVHYTGMGTIVAAIGDALSRVGDFRALRCLSAVKDKTTDADAISKANNAIEQIIKRGI